MDDFYSSTLNTDFSEIIQLRDANFLIYNSDDEIGISVVTLAEKTKGNKISEHLRHREYKKFIHAFNKTNFHIYFPSEIYQLADSLKQKIDSGDFTAIFDKLDEICESCITLMLSYFFQMICMVVILIIYENNKIIINKDERVILLKSSSDLRIINKINSIIQKCIEYEKNVEENTNRFKTRDKFEYDEIGNILFRELLRIYYDDHSHNNEINSSNLCGKKRNLNIFNTQSNDISVDNVKEIYKVHFNYRKNKHLMLEVFVPYLVRVIRSNKKFEFNDIGDLFLICCAKTIKGEEKPIKIISSDKLLKELFGDLVISPQ